MKEDKLIQAMNSPRHTATIIPVPVLLVLVVSLVLCVPGAAGHGRLMDPPSRSSMWRVGFNNPPNYDDNQLFCGGFSVQWERYGGKCGLCGDPWTGPRDNEPGGRYANGIISRKYREGQVIDVYVQLTANHKGYFEFRLCQHDDPLTNITQACLDQHLLVVDSTGQTRFQVDSAMRDVRLKLRLPRGLICKACVLQWKYNAGNSWGVDPVTQHACIGCGPQEQFYGCADVAIGHDEVVTGIPPEHFPWFSTNPPTNRRPQVSLNPGTAGDGSSHQNVLSTSNPTENPESDWHYGIAYVFGTGGERASGSSGGSEGKTVSAVCMLMLLCCALFLTG